MDTKILIFLTFFVSAWSTPWRSKSEWKRAQYMQKNPKIRGGHEAPPHAYPYVVAFTFDDFPDRNHYYFSGSLISDRWVLTGASCGDSHSLLPIVVLGAQYPDTVEPSQQVINSDAFIAHELWNNKSLNQYNIALIHLERAAELNSYVSTINFAPTDAPDYLDSSLTMISYGYTYWIVSGSTQVLRYLEVQPLPNSHCSGDVDDSNICMRVYLGDGGCLFDSGCPYVDVENGWVAGLLAATDCAETGYPDIATRVSYYSKWISDKINEK